jgi:ketopantoate reductase
MQDLFAADIMRMLERILVVGGGILAVYFAYRLSLAASADGQPILTSAEWDRLATSIDKLPRAERDDAKKLIATARARSRQNSTGSIDRRPGA